MGVVTIYVEPGEMLVATVPPATAVLHGSDFTFDVGPTRIDTDVAATRTLAQCEVDTATRFGSVGVAITRQWWNVADTTTRAQIDVGSPTRLGLDVANTRVQRNRS